MVLNTDRARNKSIRNRRLACSLHGTKDGKNKRSLIDASKAREGRSQKRNCPYEARIRLHKAAGKWELETLNRKSSCHYHEELSSSLLAEHNHGPLTTLSAAPTYRFKALDLI